MAAIAAAPQPSVSLDDADLADLEALREGLRETVAKRAALQKRFGFIPLSVLRDIKGSTELKGIFHYQREALGRQRNKTAVVQRKDARLAALGRKGGASGNRAGRGTVGISTMPPELVAFFIKYYAAPGQTYLDPFMGQGVQMQVAKRFGMHYRGYDVSREFVGYIKSVAEKIDDGQTTLQTVLGDSRKPVEIPDHCGDFGFTSPPYWDIEYYGDEKEQLGLHQTYEAFLDGMRAVAAAWRPKFKPGAYYVVNVNDFRKAARFYPYHADTIKLHQEAGWTYHDMWIIDGLVGGMSRVFATRFNYERVAPKVHEYALVFRA